MRARLIKLSVSLRGSSWFLPALIALCADAAIAIALVIDRTYGPWDLGGMVAIGAFIYLVHQVDQVVQIAARALSPSLNDPFTAMTCIDWLGAILQRFAELPRAELDRLAVAAECRVGNPAELVGLRAALAGGSR